MPAFRLLYLSFQQQLHVRPGRPNEYKIICNETCVCVYLLGYCLAPNWFYHKGEKKKKEKGAKEEHRFFWYEQSILNEKHDPMARELADAADGHRTSLVIGIHRQTG